MSLAASPTFHAIAEAVVPETAAMTHDEWRAFEALIDKALTQRPARMQRQLNAFVRLLNVLAVLQYRRPLSHLTLGQRTEFLARIQDSSMLLFRRGFWGVRTLVFMGYYARPECAAPLGYAAAPRGWELRR